MRTLQQNTLIPLLLGLVLGLGSSIVATLGLRFETILYQPLWPFCIAVAVLAGSRRAFWSWRITLLVLLLPAIYGLMVLLPLPFLMRMPIGAFFVVMAVYRVLPLDQSRILVVTVLLCLALGIFFDLSAALGWFEVVFPAQSDALQGDSISFAGKASIAAWQLVVIMGLSLQICKGKKVVETGLAEGV